MADTITLQVARYRPEEDSAVSFQEYEVPCPKEWVVLDGLNYVKDRLDGTLSYRWSCRMGICGSCGMTVNGEPKLTCATFLTDYAPGPVRVEPLQNFPVIDAASTDGTTTTASGYVESVPAGTYELLIQQDGNTVHQSTVEVRTCEVTDVRVRLP